MAQRKCVDSPGKEESDMRYDGPNAVNDDTDNSEWQDKADDKSKALQHPGEYSVANFPC